MDNLEQRLYYLEKQARECNLGFFDLEELEKSYSNLESNFIDFIFKYLQKWTAKTCKL